MVQKKIDFNRDVILEKAKTIVDSYNNLFNKGLEDSLAETKKKIKKTQEEYNKKNNKVQTGFHENEYKGDIDEVQLEDNIYKSMFDMAYKLRDSLYHTWKVQPMSYLGDKSVADFFNDISDLDLLMEILHMYSLESDYDFPDVLLEKIYSFGEQAIDKVVSSMLDERFILDNTSGDDTESSGFLIPLAAIKLLGGWKAEKGIEPIIKFYLKLFDKQKHDSLNDRFEYIDLFGEAVRQSLVNIGDASVIALVSELTRTLEYSDAQDYLVMALAEVASNKKTNEVYRCLRDIFAMCQNKMVLAEAISIYGDGRAIPALRGYLDKNINSVDNDTLYTFKLAIERLGGNIDDILALKYKNIKPNNIY